MNNIIHKMAANIIVSIHNQGTIVAGFQLLPLLREALNSFGYPAVILLVMVESLGIPLPGETMLLLASFYAATDPHLNIIFVILGAIGGAIIGDNLGYYIGHTGGKALIERYGHHFLLKPERMQKAEIFFARHGDKAVFLGRFIAVLRTWAAFLAGVNRMRWPQFLLFNALGGIAWAVLYGLLGYFAGRIFQDNFNKVEQIASNITWIITGIIAAIVIMSALLYWRRNIIRKNTK